jgi:hypothetical protein
MITINANTDNELKFYFELSEDWGYFLLVFSQDQGCLEEKIVVLNESDCEGTQLFTVNIDLPSGVYDLAIFQQEEYSNLDQSLALFVSEEKVKVVNICDQCDNMLATSCGLFIITSDDLYIEIDKEC